MAGQLLQARPSLTARSTAATNSGSTTTAGEVGTGRQVWEYLRQGVPATHGRRLLRSSPCRIIELYRGARGREGRGMAVETRCAKKPSLTRQNEFILDHAQDSGPANRQPAGKPTNTGAASLLSACTSAETDYGHKIARYAREAGCEEGGLWMLHRDVSCDEHGPIWFRIHLQPHLCGPKPHLLPMR